jgi:hypothetical protein
MQLLSTKGGLQQIVIQLTKVTASVSFWNEAWRSAMH